MQHGIVNIWSLCQRKTEKEELPASAGRNPWKPAVWIFEGFGVFSGSCDTKCNSRDNAAEFCLFCQQFSVSVCFVIERHFNLIKKIIILYAPFDL